MGIPEATEDGTQDNYEEITETPEETDSTDTSTDESDSSSDDGTGIPEATGDETYETDASTEDTLNTDSLDDASKAQFDQAEQFCEGEYNGDIAVLNTVMPNAVQPTVTLDTDTASKLTKKVLEAYLKVLKDGGATYTASETDSYVSSQLNMVNNDMKKIFSIETEPATDDILAAQSAEDRQTLYNDTMKFFEQLYGESTDTSAQQESTDETSYDEESYDEESYNEEY